MFNWKSLDDEKFFSWKFQSIQLLSTSLCFQIKTEGNEKWIKHLISLNWETLFKYFYWINWKFGKMSSTEKEKKLKRNFESKTLSLKSKLCNSRCTWCSFKANPQSFKSKGEAPRSFSSALTTKNQQEIVSGIFPFNQRASFDFKSWFKLEAEAISLVWSALHSEVATSDWYIRQSILFYHVKSQSFNFKRWNSTKCRFHLVSLSFPELKSFP